MTLLLPRKRLSRLPRGITAYWPLDASTCEFGSGQVRPLDLVGNNYGVDAKSMGAAGLPPFDGGGIGYNFNARTNTYLTLNADPLNGTGVTKDLTILFWVYARSYENSDTAAAGTLARPICFSTDVILALDTGLAGTGFPAGTITVDGGATGNSTSLLPLGGWTRVAVAIVGNNGAAKIYFNGADVTGANGGGNGGTVGTWAIGCRDALNRVMDGKMAHVMVCQGTVLTAAEIADDYNSFFAAEEVMPALFLSAAAPPPTGVNFTNLMLMGVG